MLRFGVAPATGKVNTVPSEPSRNESSPVSWLSRVSLAHRKLVLLITLGVLAIGVYSIPTLKQQLLS